MVLTPKRPPGRLSRKARAYADDIRRLYAEGYTLEAIREALAEQGVQVSKSTVQREVAWRPRRTLPPEPPATTPTVLQRPPPIVPSNRPQDVADEVFGDGQMSNPLYRNRSAK